jgi:hypothetical protein
VTNQRHPSPSLKNRQQSNAGGFRQGLREARATVRFASPLLLWTLIVALAPSAASAQIAPLHRDRQAMIVDTYRSALGRDPMPQELYFWALYPETPPGIINAKGLFATLLQTLRNSAVERESTARRALSAVFESEEAGSSQLRTYVEDGRNPPLRRATTDLLLQRDGGGYRGLVAWLSRPEVRQHFVEQTGMTSTIAGATRP